MIENKKKLITGSVGCVGSETIRHIIHNIRVSIV
jgi:hypothetical protein